MATPMKRKLRSRSPRIHLQPFTRGSRDLGGLSSEDRSPGAQDPQGSSGLFYFPDKTKQSLLKEVGNIMANVLFSDLLVPGWADSKIGLKSVTGTYGDRHAFTLPCHTSDPELFFSEEKAKIERAKSLCTPCPVRAECLKGALSREEPCGVWGGELFLDGEVIAERRGVGRPRLVRVG